MTILCLLLLFGFSFVFLLLRYFKISTVTFFVAIVWLFLVGNGLVPSLLLKTIQQPFESPPPLEWKTKNVIVLLGAGTIKIPVSNTISPAIMSYSRINETALLYFACVKRQKICKILISGGDVPKIGKSEAIVYQDILLNLGVKNSDILLEPNSMNTFQNAEFSATILKKIPFDQVILVTSGVHLKRSLLFFSHFGIKAAPRLADYLTAHSSFLPLGYNFAMADFVIHEYMGILRFHMYNFLGWNGT